MRNGSPAKLRVAIAGLGAIGCEVAKALDRGIDGLELAAVSAANIDKHRAWIDRLGARPATLPIEALADAVHALPPFSADEAARLVGRLRIAPLLGSRRHRRPVAMEEFCRVAARFSALAAALGDEVAEIDLNPVIVHADGCAIVDALLVPRPAHNLETEQKRKAR